MNGERGMALVSALLLTALLAALLTGYFVLTAIETRTTQASMDATRGFYAAEAGLNLRAEAIRATFLGYNRPAGTSPAPPGPCENGNEGSGDFACAMFELSSRTVDTWVVEEAGNPRSIVIPRGEAYQNLHAQEYLYTANAVAENARGRTEALLEMQFKSRLVPMFQFAAFYNKDLEILPGPAMTLDGPVHVNGDLYLGTDNTLVFNGQITSSGSIWRGRKNQNACMTGSVSVYDPVTLQILPACSGARRKYTQAELNPWNGMVQIGVESVTVPGPEALEPHPGALYFDEADLRVVLDLNGAAPEVQVRSSSNVVSAADTDAVAACAAASTSQTFHNNREAATIRMLDVDLEALLDCAHAHNLLGAAKGLDDSSEGGLVFYFSVLGPDSGGRNAYGVRIRNGAEIASSLGNAPEVKGLTVVTDQAVYVQGDYNAVRKKPAAFLADSINVLSNAWSDGTSTQALSNRRATSTTVNAAFLSGTDTTGGEEGTAGQGGAYNGGLENYPRFHEDWSGRTFTYRGSLVSLNRPLHVGGAWVYGSPYYTAPTRAWSYETDFNDAAKLPPLSPRFVYLRQELFVRRFE